MAEIGLKGFDGYGVVVDGDCRPPSRPVEPQAETAGPREQIESCRPLQFDMCDSRRRQQAT